MSANSTTAEFSVYAFYDDADTEYHAECEFVSAETAVRTAVSLVKSVAGRTGFIKRVIVTDGSDSINWEWRHGFGVVFPKDES
ncbi:MAG: hypothetical protein C5B54_04240 [Acidobacteria bacterium]|nr:MAG: hypothetical protein C5B54_04240 [Acidobacteriota bacterium]